MKCVVLVLPAVAALALSGCGAAPSRDASAREGKLTVTASFYPLQWVSERVGGTHVAVTSLTKPGAEPHDLELTPKEVGAMTRSSVVVYLGGFQPAVDDAVRSQAEQAGFDVSPIADLNISATGDGHTDTAENPQDLARNAPLPGARDPHFWLDPVRLEKVATAIGERFASVDPAHTTEYRSNAATLGQDLRTLDQEFRAGLASCRSNELVTGHAAFAYLAQRYGLSQEGIAGISPDSEPDAATLRDLATHVKERGVTTVYTETLVSPALAQTLAREAGAAVAVLDPLEGITDTSKGTDYLEVMRSNLVTLEAGQQCG